MVFHIASSPYNHNQRQTAHIMFQVAICCLPGIAAQIFFFGFGTLVQIILAVVSAIAAEGLVMRLRQRPLLPTLRDNSALLTGLLLGISLPPLTPWWMVVLGGIFAIIIAKQLYGGLGNNPFNPAMVGYVVLLISFPVQMTGWLPPAALAASHAGWGDILGLIFTGRDASGLSLNDLRLGIDGISQATPLDNFKTGIHSGHAASTLLAAPIYGGMLAGIGWQWVNVGYLLGGLALLWKGAIRWHIPVAFIASLAICAGVGQLIAPERCAPLMVHLFSGATMFGAFFILTDPVTASTTNKGRLLFGAIAGLLVWLIRTYGGYPDGVAFAVLLANITVPLIDHYTQPRVYGHRRG